MNISNAVYTALTRRLPARLAPFQQNLNIPPATLTATFTNRERRVGLCLPLEGNHFQSTSAEACPRNISFRG
jgi:hypothetical protein